MRRLTLLLAAASALSLSGCGVVKDMRAEYVANRALVQARMELLSPQPDREKAVEKLDLVFRLRSNDPEFLQQLAGPYQMLGESGRALECLEPLRADAPLAYKTSAAPLLMELGEMERGEQLLDEALTEGRAKYGLDTPRQLAMVLNNVGYCIVDAGVRVEEGMVLIEEAVALQPLEPNYIDSLGWALYRQGESKRAAFHLERAARLLPGNSSPEVLWHLGAVHARLRHFRRAEWELKQALSLDPSNEEARRMLRGLQLELPVPARV
ncbi:MAG TPA: hypothetical protein QGH10_17625 [Armatimonadota bacterium]|nr:hypothetical protein [Armatimonadota bacterium]